MRQEPEHPAAKQARRPTCTTSLCVMRPVASRSKKSKAARSLVSVRCCSSRQAAREGSGRKGVTEEGRVCGTSEARGRRSALPGTSGEGAFVAVPVHSMRRQTHMLPETRGCGRTPTCKELIILDAAGVADVERLQQLPQLRLANLADRQGDMRMLQGMDHSHSRSPTRRGAYARQQLGRHATDHQQPPLRWLVSQGMRC